MGCKRLLKEFAAMFKAGNSQKEYISAVVTERKRLSDRLGAISCRSKSPEFSPEDVAKHRKYIALLREKLNDSSIDGLLDTRKIDEVLYLLCDCLQEAYDNGDKLSVTSIFDTLNYGIMQGHRPLGEEENRNASRVMQQRMEKLELHIKICEMAEEMYALRRHIDKQNERLEKCLVMVEQYYKDIEAFELASIDNMMAVKQVKTSGGDLTCLRGVALEYATLLKRLELHEKEVEELKGGIAISEAMMQDLSDMITAIQKELECDSMEESKEELLKFLKSFS